MKVIPTKEKFLNYHKHMITLVYQIREASEINVFHFFYLMKFANLVVVETNRYANVSKNKIS